MAWTQKQLEDLKRRHDAWILSQPGVGAVGLAFGVSSELCIEVSTDGITTETRRPIEARLKDAPVVFVHAGSINAQ